MSQVTLKELERRVAALEKMVAELVQAEEEPQKKGGPIKFKDWRKAIGTFPGTELTRQIDEEGRKIREADRRKAGDYDPPRQRSSDAAAVSRKRRVRRARIADASGS
jgi:hypothetical protein